MVVAEALLEVLLEVVDVLEVGARVVVTLDTVVPLTAATLFYLSRFSQKEYRLRMT